MRGRRILVAIVGLAQGAIGVLTSFFVFLLYFDFLGVQAAFNVSAEHVPLFLLILSVFSAFSVISAFFLVHEGFG